jgi:Putative transposase
MRKRYEQRLHRVAIELHQDCRTIKWWHQKLPRVTAAKRFSPTQVMGVAHYLRQPPSSQVSGRGVTPRLNVRLSASPACVLKNSNSPAWCACMSIASILPWNRRGPTTIAFRWKDYRVDGPTAGRRCGFSRTSCIRRFLIHVLPKGFHRIRHYGIFALSQPRREHRNGPRTPQPQCRSACRRSPTAARCCPGHAAWTAPGMLVL